MKICAFLLVLLSVCSVLGADASSTTGELQVARQALRDGFYDIARRHAGNVVTNQAAKLVILESYARERRWNDVESALSEFSEAKGPAFDYYRAVLKGDVETAAKLLGQSGSETGEDSARMLWADLAFKKGEFGKAQELWRQVIASTNATARAFATAAINLEDEAALRKAIELQLDIPFKRRIALRLGMVLVRAPKTCEEGEGLIRRVVKDSPDTSDAMEAYIALAESESINGRLADALKTFNDTIETWPEAGKRSRLRLGRGDVLHRLSRREDALEDYRLAESLAADDTVRAKAFLRQGEVLSELGRGAEALDRYRKVLSECPATEVARALEKVVKARERELDGRSLYAKYDFEEAEKVFAEVAAQDSARAPRMSHFKVLCLYGRGLDEEAHKQAIALVESTKDAVVRADVVLWLGKRAYNRGEWKEATARFLAFAEGNPGHTAAPSALLWAARAAFYGNDYEQAKKLSNRLWETYPEAPEVIPAMIVQCEALIELAAYEDAARVLQARVLSSDKASQKDRQRAQILKADAFFALGGDDSAYYKTALEEYRQVWFEARLEPSVRIVVAFKIARTLEKLKRADEAWDFYLVQVVNSYCDGQERGAVFDDEAKSAFLRAAFRLADDCEERGRVDPAVSTLNKVIWSDAPEPVKEEARRRVEKLNGKGRF